MKKTLFVIAVWMLFTAGAFAQVTFNSSPVTTATVGSAYSSPIVTTTTTNNPITITSVNTLPSWLSLVSSGDNAGQRIGGTVAGPGAVASDPNGNFYVVQNSGSYIYKITPDGTTSIWANRNTTIGQTYGGAIVVGNYLYVTYYGCSVGSIERFDLNSTNTAQTGTLIYSGYGLLSMTHYNGYLYAADYCGGRIVRVKLADNTSEVYLSGLTATGPFGVGLTPSGELLYTQFGQNELWKYTPSNNTRTRILSSLPASPSDVKIDADGNVYVSFYGAKIRKYKPDFSSFVEVSGSVTNVWGMSLSASGVLAYGDNSGNAVYRLQTGATLKGTPAIGDIGTYPIAIQATDGTTTANQNYTLTVYGPSTIASMSNMTKLTTDAPFTLTDPTSNSSGAFTYSSSNTSVATVSGNTITLTGAGTATITATQAASGLYLQTTKTFTLTVTAPPSISSITPNPINAGQTLTISGTSLGGASSVTIGGQSVPFTVVNSSTLTVTVPTPSNSGAVKVTVSSATVSGAVQVASNTSASSYTGWSGAWQKLTTSSAGALSTVTLSLTNLDTSNDYDLYLELHSTDNDPSSASPSNKFNSLLETSATVRMAKNTNQGEVVFSFPGTTKLSANTAYYVVLKEPNTNPAGTGYQGIDFDYAASQDGGAGGHFGPLYYKFTVAPYLTVINPPIITTSGTLSAFSTCAGSPSTTQNFTVTGANLTNNITVTAPSGYEVSTAAGSGFAATATLTQTGGAVNTTVYVRMTGNGLGSFAGNIALTSTGATTQNMAVTGTSTGPLAFGNALNFDGVNDFVSIPDANALDLTTAFTIEAWVYPTSATGSQVIIGKIMDTNAGNSADLAYALRFNSGNLSAEIGNGSTAKNVASNSLLLNKWQHVAMVYQGSTGNLSLYIDGVLKGTTATGWTSIQNNTASVKFGSYGSYFPQYFKGSLDEVRFWNTARTQAEISAAMYTQLSTTETGLVAHYIFNQGIGSGNNTAIATVTDRTPNAFTGTLNNFAKIGSTSNFVSTLSGPSTICANGTAQYTHVVSGGTWSISNGAAATVSSTGLVTAAGPETFTLSYTVTGVGSCSATINKQITVFSNNGLGNALSVDGVDDYVAVGDVYENLGAFTTEAWVYWRGSTQDYSEIFTKEGISAFAITRANRLHGNFGNGSSWGAGVDSNTPIPLNTWTHLAVTRTASGTIKLYINGVLDNATIVNNNTGQNTAPRLIGAKMVGSTLWGPFNGIIDEIRVWDTDRTAQQIASTMNQELSGTEPGLLSYYDFNQGIAGGNNSTITTIIDRAANAFHGTMYNIAKSGTTSNLVAGNVMNYDIAGLASICANSTAPYTHLISGGVWSVGNGAFSTVNSSGLLTTLAAENTTINYTYNLKGCSFTATKALVVDAPAAPTVSNVSYSQGATATPLSATGTNLLWYTVATGGTASSTAPTPSTSTPGTTSYWVSQNSTGCESTRAQISVTVLALPVITSLSPSVVNAGMTLTLTGTNLSSATSLTIGGVNAAITYNDATTVRVTVPANTANGNVVLTNANGTSNTLTVVVDNVTLAPTLSSPVSGATIGATISIVASLPESPLAGSVKLTFVRATGNPVVWTLANASSYNFSLNPLTSALSASQVLSVSGGNLTKGVYTVVLSYQDAMGNPVATASSANVTLQGTAPTNISLSNAAIAENNAIGDVIGNLSSTDADAGDTFTYSLVSGAGSTDNASFTIAGNQLKAAAAFDYETKTSYSIRVRSTDAAGLTFDKAFTIAITDVVENVAPTDIAINTNRVYEKNLAGTVVGTLSTIDPDANDTHSYTLVSGDLAAFTLSGNQLKAVAPFNFNTKNSYSIRVRTTDAGGLSLEKVLTITIIPLPQLTGTGNVVGSNVPTSASAQPTISKGYSTQLNVSGSGILNYTWAPSTGLSATNIPNPVAKPGQTTTYTVTVTHSSGATISLPITVTVNVDYNITPNNILTPNGDGQNDLWVIENISSYPNNSVKVFDVNGHIVFSATNYQNTWSPSQLQSGTYYFMIDFGTGIAIQKGFITIVK